MTGPNSARVIAVLLVVTTGSSRATGRGRERHVAQVQVVDDGAEVVGERVEVVAVAGLVRAPAPAAVVGDASQIAVDQGGKLSYSHMSEFSPQPWTKTTGAPDPQSRKKRAVPSVEFR